MTPLAALLRQRILDQGPLPFIDFMASCLTHPVHGYSVKGCRIGRRGDFITAPETSQIFGELIGLWMVDCWEKLNCPDRFRLIELGPGNGLLMQDALRAAALRPAFGAAAEIHLVETNTDLMAVQKRILGKVTTYWHKTVDSLPSTGPLIVIANEFFDALPVRILRLTKQGWRERYVDWRENSFVTTQAMPQPPFPDKTDHALGPVLESHPDHSDTLPSDTVPSDTTHSDTIPSDTIRIREIRPAAAGLLSALLKRAATGGGYGLVIDYGYTEPPDCETIEAIRHHEYVDPLSKPGETDLAAHVDFTRLCDHVRNNGATVYGPISQRRFLTALGLARRALSLLAQANQKQQECLQSALHRLMASSGMGLAFRVMAFSSPGLPSPDGFEH